MPGAAQRLFLERKPQRLDQMEPGARSEAEAGDVAGVRRNFGFDQDDMEHRTRLLQRAAMKTTDEHPIAENVWPTAPARAKREISLVFRRTVHRIA